MFPNPDFEEYDNAGRDTEQVRATKYGMATYADLLRVQQRDAQSFLAEHPLPDRPLPDLDLAAYLSALAAAETPAETSAVTQHLLDTAAPVMRVVSDYLLEAAQWRGQLRDATKGSPPQLLLDASGRILHALGIAYEADHTSLRAEYDPGPAPRPPSPGRPPGPPFASPGAPPAGPAPGP